MFWHIVILLAWKKKQDQKTTIYFKTLTKTKIQLLHDELMLLWKSKNSNSEKKQKKQKKNKIKKQLFIYYQTLIKIKIQSLHYCTHMMN